MYNLAGYIQRRGYVLIGEENSQQIEGEERLTCYGYKVSHCKRFIFHVIAILFAGIPYVLLQWSCKYATYSKHSKCSLTEAEMVLIQNSHGQYSLEQIFTSVCTLPGAGQVRHIRHFHHHLLKFVWDDEVKGFIRLYGYDDGKTSLIQLHGSCGFTANEQEQMVNLYGENVITVNVKSYWQLFVEEVFNPFYIFQAFSVILWSLDDYFYYAGCIVFLTIVSVVTSLFQTRKQSKALRDLVATLNATTVTVCRRDKVCVDISASCLVPGDIIIIPPHGCVMACDAVLLTGSCIVNESMLTGESVPVTKTPPPVSDECYDPVRHKKHTLFSGTQIIQTRFYGNNKVMAVVVRTGFATSKGELVRSILFPKPMSGFKFYQDSVRFVIFLFFTSALGMVYCIHLYVKRHASVGTILLRTLDIITIVVPPALPAAMTAGTVYSQNRLKKLGIYCVSPQRINVCGKVKLVCFDKTGTLTEEGLNLWGVLPSVVSKFCAEPVQDPSLLPIESPFIAAMATCHSLTFIGRELTGDPLDLLMFEATQWELEEPGQDTSRYDMLSPTVVKPRLRVHNQLPIEIGIIRQFPFGSSSQCMSVVARTLGSSCMTLYTKGAPERINSLCRKETVPANFESILTEYTLTGYRVIALAYKNLAPKFSWRQAQRANRDQLENDLEFLGLLIMQNALKPETAPTIAQLQMAQVRCVMVTGDNIFTAVSVARDCGMVHPYEQVIQITVKGDTAHLARIGWEVVGVPQTLHHGITSFDADCILPLIPNGHWHIAVDGKTWTALNNFHSELLPQIVTRGTVFARMAPDQKTQLVEMLHSLDYVVAMCGDGANDCGALKAAHIGISLSEAEPSVAAPFTSAVANITCVLKLIQEGRCALVTSFGIFKYMAMYSMIQFVTVLILYKYASILGTMQFLYIDLFVTTSIAVLMGRTDPSARLVSKRPMGSLTSANNIVPLILQVLVMVAVQIATLYFLMKQPWFEPVKEEGLEEEVIVCWESTSLFSVSSFQYLILAAVYSKGKPHRKPFYTNLLLLVTLVFFTAFTTLLLVYPVEPLASFFEVMPVSQKSQHLTFRLWLLAFPSAHLIIAVFIERCVADTRCLKQFLRRLTNKNAPKSRYKRIDRDMLANNSWLSEASL